MEPWTKVPTVAVENLAEWLAQWRKQNPGNITLQLHGMSPREGHFGPIAIVLDDAMGEAFCPGCQGRGVIGAEHPWLNEGDCPVCDGAGHIPVVLTGPEE